MRQDHRDAPIGGVAAIIRSSTAANRFGMCPRLAPSARAHHRMPRFLPERRQRPALAASASSRRRARDHIPRESDRPQREDRAASRYHAAVLPLLLTLILLLRRRRLLI
jgi:hypothetical protein